MGTLQISKTSPPATQAGLYRLGAMTIADHFQKHPPTPPAISTHPRSIPACPMSRQESTRKAPPRRPALRQRSTPPVAQEESAGPTFEWQKPPSQVLRSPQAQLTTM